MIDSEYIIKDNMNKSDDIVENKAKETLESVNKKMQKFRDQNEDCMREYWELSMFEGLSVDISEDKKKEILESVMKLLSEEVHKAIILKAIGDDRINYVDYDMDRIVKKFPVTHPFSYLAFRSWCKNSKISDELAIEMYKDIAYMILGSHCPIYDCFLKLVDVFPEAVAFYAMEGCIQYHHRVF